MRRLRSGRRPGQTSRAIKPLPGPEGFVVALLRAAWRRAVEESGCEVVSIVGEPGVGKSRLVVEFLAGVAARVVRGVARCEAPVAPMWCQSQ